MPTASAFGRRTTARRDRSRLDERPIVVLADEPSGNLDADLAEETMRLFLKIRERGTTIIIASHDLDFSQRYRTRVICLQEGCLVDDLKPTKEARTG
jgi:cell division transport system ATP-binding protein